jgi:hypothetical protein
MNDVFKHYGVCDDVADKITLEVHRGYQQVINDHLSVIIGWDIKFDYWTFGNFKPKTLFWPYKEPYFLERVSKVILTLLKNRYDNVFKKKLKNIKPTLTKEEYTSYVLSGKKVFMMCRPVRWNRFVDGLDNKYYTKKKWDRELPVITLSVYLSETTLLMNRQYNRYNQEKLENLISNPDYDPVSSFIHKETLQKKHLISWLNNNGDPRKLTNKTKKQLWDMVIKMK